MPDLSQIIQTASIWAIPVLLAITLHEAAHGYVAKLNGDRMAEMLGRVTLNPFKHIDPLGTIIMPIVCLVAAPFIIGWAKPVPVNFNNLKDERWSVVAVALAGPAANLFLALVSVLLIHVVMYLPLFFLEPLLLMLLASIKINLLLMMFNLLPILPLDGGRVLCALLPKPAQYMFNKTEKWGMVIILALAFTGVLFTLIQPMMNFGYGFLLPLLPEELLRLGGY